MSPFSAFLHDIRVRRDLRQADLAEMMGYERSYIAALESSIKGPPTDEFVDSLIRALCLSDQEQHSLSESLLASERKLVLSPQSSQEIYWLLSDLRRELSTLHPAQIRAIRSILAMPCAPAVGTTETAWRAKRRSKEEAPM